MRQLKMTLMGFLSVALFATTFVGCKGKDDPEPDKAELKLEGLWQFESMDFLDEASIRWDANVAYNSSTSFGYAPTMFEGTQGFDFGIDETKNKEGFAFNFLSEGDEHNQDPSKIYWFWNYLDGKKNFEIQQINPSMPPYDFSFKEIKNVVVRNNGDEIEFEAVVNSRKPGGAFTDINAAPVKIVMKRGTPTKDVKILVNGEPYVAPSGEDASNRAKLLNTSWKLKSGSDLYDPGMTDTADTSKTYLQLMAFKLLPGDTLSYRYSFPMGIVSPKQFVQDELNNDVLKTKHGGGAYGGPEQIIRWEIVSVDLTAKEVKLKDQKSGTVRAFVQIDNIEEGVDKSDYHIITE